VCWYSLGRKLALTFLRGRENEDLFGGERDKKRPGGEEDYADKFGEKGGAACLITGEGEGDGSLRLENVLFFQERVDEDRKREGPVYARGEREERQSILRSWPARGKEWCLGKKPSPVRGRRGTASGNFQRGRFVEKKKGGKIFAKPHWS